MTIGSKIRKYRKQQGLTQKELAKLSGLNEVTIRSYEADKYKPKQENLRKLAKALGLYIGELDAEWAKDINLENIDLRDFALELSDLNNAITRKYEYEKKTLLNTLEANSIIYIQDIQEQKIISDFRELNGNGKMEALKRIQELTEIKKYTEDLKHYAEFVSNKTPEYWDGLKNSLQVAAAHNDQAEEPGELEKMQEDVEKLKRLED